jgi:hypothetical protein
VRDAIDEALELQAHHLEAPGVLRDRLDARAVRLGVLALPRFEVLGAAAEDHPHRRIGRRVLGLALHLDHDVQPRLLVLDGEPQQIEAAASERVGLLVEREEQVAEVVGAAFAVVEQHDVVDHERHRVVDA